MCHSYRRLKMFLFYSFKLLGSRPIHREPFGFSTITWEFSYSVSSLSGLLMPILVILFSSTFNLFFNAKGIFLGGLITGELKDQQLCGVLCLKFQFHQNSPSIFLGGLITGELKDQQLCGVLCLKFQFHQNSPSIFLGGLITGELKDQQLCGVLCSKFQFHQNSPGIFLGGLITGELKDQQLWGVFFLTQLIPFLIACSKRIVFT